MIAEMLQAVSEIPESEGIKIGIFCPCGGNLQTITDDFSIEAQDRIGAKEIVRCAVCFEEYDADDNERLKAQSQGYSTTTANQTKLCA